MLLGTDGDNNSRLFPNTFTYGANTNREFSNDKFYNEFVSSTFNILISILLKINYVYDSHDEVVRNSEGRIFNIIFKTNHGPHSRRIIIRICLYRIIDGRLIQFPYHLTTIAPSKNIRHLPYLVPHDPFTVSRIPYLISPDSESNM
jgi:hypothetical protein